MKVMESDKKVFVFWKTVRKLQNKPSAMPVSLKLNDFVISDKTAMADTFNSHFIKSVFVFENTLSKGPTTLQPTAHSPHTVSPFSLLQRGRF